MLMNLFIRYFKRLAIEGFCREQEFGDMTKREMTIMRHEAVPFGLDQWISHTMVMVFDNHNSLLRFEIVDPTFHVIVFESLPMKG